MPDLCVRIREFILEFNSEIEGSHAVMLFLFPMLWLMCSGSSSRVTCIFPFGMLCLFA